MRPPIIKDSLLGQVVECSLAGHDGKWMVFEDKGGPCVKIQRPQDHRARWVDKKFITIARDVPFGKWPL